MRPSKQKPHEPLEDKPPKALTTALYTTLRKANKTIVITLYVPKRES